ncbi:hypothetical protein [Streptomyces mirabilis]
MSELVGPRTVVTVGAGGPSAVRGGGVGGTRLVEEPEGQLRDWHRPRDLLPDGFETVLGADSVLHETVDRIMFGTGLALVPALDR